MPNRSETELENEKRWRTILMEGLPDNNRLRHLFRHLPKNPRCKQCFAPFEGVGGFVARSVFNKRRSSHNPQLCSVCEDFAARYPGGAEIDIGMVFIDVRGSTQLAEGMSPTEFRRLINRFYNISVDVLIEHGGVIDRLVGDEMIGYFMPGTAGPDYPRHTLEAALALLQATGYADASGPWIPVGIGVHKGVAFFGSVGTKDGVTDITALGDVVNSTARLASQAGAGEILVSEEAYAAAGIDLGNLEQRQLSLKGRSEPLAVRVFQSGLTRESTLS